MLRNGTSKSRLLQSGLNGPIYSSSRCVHWFHNYKYAGAPRDRYELDNREPEFGQDEITDKDRNPHLYWGIWQGRNMIQRVVNQFGYSKDLKPEKLKRDFEKFTYFAKLDALHFMQEDRSNYPWMEDDADGAIGYNTDEGDTDERYEHNDYGKFYKDASPTYNDMVLRDQCQGRPVYEWQIPYGLDEAYGYKEVSTAVDVLGNDNAINNLDFEWTIGHIGETSQKGTLLKNNLTGQELLICDLKDAGSTIESFHPTTVVLPCGAEKLLTSVRSRFSPSSRTDLYGCFVGLAWSVTWAASEFWPADSVFSLIFGGALIGLNTTTFYRTFIHPTDNLFKGAFAACKEIQCNVVLGDWLYDDYDERQHTVEPFDEIAIKLNDPSHATSTLSLSSINNTLSTVIKQTDETGTGFSKTVKAIGEQVTNALTTSGHHGGKEASDVATNNWMSSYRDVVNNRRLDLLAHVLNNVEGEKILIPVNSVDDISSDLVSSLLVRRLTGTTPIRSPPMKFDSTYERVSIEFS